MPEFDGVIEPIYIGAGSSSADGEKPREPLPDRCRKVAARVRKWITLAKKPVSKRKVAFILNNNPCANADANIGAATHLDSLESVARILSHMKDAGYAVEPPALGKSSSTGSWSTRQSPNSGGRPLTISWQRAGRSCRWTRPCTAHGSPRSPRPCRNG